MLQHVNGHALVLISRAVLLIVLFRLVATHANRQQQTMVMKGRLAAFGSTLLAF